MASTPSTTSSLCVGLTDEPARAHGPGAGSPRGRLEVQVLVLQPDVAGRQRILAIHSRRLRARGSLNARAAAAISSHALGGV